MLIFYKLSNEEVLSAVQADVASFDKASNAHGLPIDEIGCKVLVRAYTNSDSDKQYLSDYDSGDLVDYVAPSGESWGESWEGDS